MDTQIPFDTLPPAVVGRSRLGRLMDILLGKVVTLVLAAVALLLAIVTFVLLSGGAPITQRPNVVFASILASAAVLLLLGAVVAGRLTRVWVERRRGSAGSRLHVRLVLMFGVVAVTPSIVVAVFAAAFFNLGIQSWFDDRIRKALDSSVDVGAVLARGASQQHQGRCARRRHHAESRRRLPGKPAGAVSAGPRPGNDVPRLDPGCDLRPVHA